MPRWKQINKLTRDTGVPVESVKGRGYRIQGGLELLSEDAVIAALAPDASGLLHTLEIHDAIDSTNAEAMRQDVQDVTAALAGNEADRTAAVEHILVGAVARVGRAAAVTAASQQGRSRSSPKRGYPGLRRERPQRS